MKKLLIFFIIIMSACFISSSFCCEKSVEGGTCIDVENENECDMGNSITENLCDVTDFCQIGCCIDSESGSCSKRSSESECVGGEWKNDPNCGYPECDEVCCYLDYGSTGMMFEEECRLKSAVIGKTPEFDSDVNENECFMNRESVDEGACINGINCKFVKENDCGTGVFKIGMLCSNKELEKEFGYDYIETHHADCMEGLHEVYWFDSENNRENIFEGKGTQDKIRSYNKGLVLEKSESCDPRNILGNLENQNCGNCNYDKGATCSNINGNPVCASLNCKYDIDGDGEDEYLIHGESFCVYDGTIEDGKSIVGSEHWKGYCDNGKIKIDVCGDGGRTSICSQTEALENGNKFKHAECVFNDVERCFEYNSLIDDPVRDDEGWDDFNSIGKSYEEMEEKCRSDNLCYVNHVNVDEYFDYTMCVPRFPSSSPEYCINGSKICEMKSWSTTSIGVKNENCFTPVFIKEMNNLCISLGDCGAQINLNGEMTRNYGTKFFNILDTNNYVFPVIVEDSFGMINLLSLDRIDKISSLSTLFGNIEDDLYNIIYLDNRLYFEKYFFGNFNNAIEKMFSDDSDNKDTAIGSLTPIDLKLAKKIIDEDIGRDENRKLYIAILEAYSIIQPDFISSLIRPHLDEYFNLETEKKVQNIDSNYITKHSAKDKFDSSEFTCDAWVAPKRIDEDMCEICNDDPSRPCTEYQCKSLGQGCELVGLDTDHPLCKGREAEIAAPIISPGNIFTEGYGFYGDLSPISIKNQHSGSGDKCIEEYTRIEFNLETDEPANCRYDNASLRLSYDEMSLEFKEGKDYTLNHTLWIKLPSVESYKDYQLENNWEDGIPTIQLSDGYEIDVKCSDYWGNANLHQYIIDFCVKNSPDDRKVLLSKSAFTPENKSYIMYNQNEMFLEMMINEPANCKWSHEDLSYESMENEFKCDTEFDTNALDIQWGNEAGWRCTSSLTGLDSDVNNVYIRCNDSVGNINDESLVYTVLGSSSPLKIDDIKFVYNGEDEMTRKNFETFVVGSVDSIDVDMIIETSGGAQEGNATCKYDSGDRVNRMLHTGSNIHSQLLTGKTDGIYNYIISCKDIAGNRLGIEDFSLELFDSSMEGNAGFTVIIDDDAPIIVRAMKDSEKNKLKIITNEDAECRYSLDDCSFKFDEGIKFETGFDALNIHRADWLTEIIYYVKCADYFGNGKHSTKCNMEIKPTDISVEN